MSSPEDKTVLVVDDEDDIRTFLCTLLEDEGFQVMSAADGEEALERMREKVPDFVSLDLVMPRKSGIRFLHEVRRNRKWRDVPVLIVTGHARDELGKQDLEEAVAGRMIAGRGAYLEKPVNASSYLRAVRRALGMAEDTAAPVAQAAELKDEVRGLLDDADPATLEALKQLLKSRG